MYPSIDASAAVAGVLMALLFLLMPITPVHGVSPDLAPARHSVRQAGAAREDALVVAVMRDGQVFFRSVRTSPEELETQIRSGLRQGAEKKVYLWVDARARYARVVVVLDEIKRAGVENVSFITQ